MSRRLALLATAAVAASLAASPAWAIFGKKKAEPAPAAQAASPDPSQAQAGAAQARAEAAPLPPRRATAQERAMADRLDPLARSAFWSREAELDPQDAEAGVKFAASLRALEQPDRAVAAAERVLLVHPDNQDALMELARAHLARGQGFYAIKPLEALQAANPRDWRPLSLLGVAYDQTQRTAEARQVWQRALALSPDNPAVLSNLAMSHAAAGEVEQAERLLRQAVARPGASIQVRQNLALVLGLQGKTAEAEQWLRRDLPPEVANANLAWLRAASRTGPQAAAVKAPTGAEAPAAGRSWDALRGGGQ